MNGLYVSAMTLGSAANAIFLQYTAPMWMYLASVWWLARRPSAAIPWPCSWAWPAVAVILAGGSQGENIQVVALGLGSASPTRA